MFGKMKDKEKLKVMSNYDIIREIFEGTEKYATKTIADFVSAQGGVTLGDLDPALAAYFESSMEYYNSLKVQSLEYAKRMDFKELELDKKLEKQKMLLEEQNAMLKELLNKK